MAQITAMNQNRGGGGGGGETALTPSPDLLDSRCLVVVLITALLCADAPTVSEGRDVGVTLGQRGELECEADAVPVADFEWYKDDRR